MSFSEFMRWIRNFFNSQSAANSSSGSSASSTNLPASEITTSAVSPSTPDPVVTTSPTITPPRVSEPSINQPTTTTTANPEAAPPPLPETTAPSISTPVEPPPKPQNTPPVISLLTTADSKVALNQAITFQIVTNPANQYKDCSLDLTSANNASIVQAIDPVSGQFSLKFDKVSSSDNDTQLIQVKNPQGTTSTAVTVSLMRLFWHNHPGRKNVCDETLFVNQCAIRMGTALELSGIKMSQDRRILRRCTTEYRAFKHHKEGVVKGHVLAAQELANWIKSQRSTFGSRSIVRSQEEILGRSGIIFFRDGWGTTDHIDVWDGQSLVGGFPSYFDSDFKELWFWDVY